jgi:3-oxoacyl-[acyl-carrier protein] reductase
VLRPPRKVALVTGSTRGIGWAVAERLAESGATVLLHGTEATRVQGRAAELRRRFGGEHAGFCFDVGKPHDVASAFRQVFSEHRGLDVLVNNAGMLDGDVLGGVSAQAAERTFAVNALGVLHAMQGGARLMERRGGGSIVNVTSMNGSSGAPGKVAYAGAKAAVVGMTRAAAEELAPKRVRVNAVAAGIDGSDEVTRTICFLASDDAADVTGQVLGL